MKFPIFASFIVFVIWLTLFLRKQSKKEQNDYKSFWEREEQANSTRKKSLDNLSYITIPDSILSLTPATEKGQDAMQILKSLSTEKIVNFTGYSNTDLKLEYGVANLQLLMEYDQNFTSLIEHLQALAQDFLDTDKKETAKKILEFAVSVHSDLSRSFEDLAGIYLEENRPEKIEDLRLLANELNSLSKKRILALLDRLDVSGLL